MVNHLILYAKRPFAGYTKTRLAAGIGAEEAAGVSARLLYFLLADMNKVQSENAVDCTLSLASPEDVPFFKAAFPEWNVTAQINGNLGERMAASIQQALVSGATKVVLAGSDIPSLNHRHILEAFQSLDANEIVLGPTLDGGFYLIGTTVPVDDIFEDIPWSTPEVLQKCLQKAKQENLSIDCIRTLSDMDTEKEYFQWQQRLMGRANDKE